MPNTTRLQITTTPYTLTALCCTILFSLFTAATALANDQLIDPELRELLKKAVNESDSFVDRFEAEVWLMDMSNRLKPRLPDNTKRLHLLKLIHREARRNDLHPELVLAVIDVESNFNRYAISKAGAMGLMQVMPFWLKEIGRPGDNLFSIRTNLRMGCTILKYYLDKEKGNLTHALMRYNGSKGSYRYTTKVFRALDKKWRN
ncbi:MAG: lytic transglycosylase domain-containing protein [Gammaproteobacteria bacterium]|nr:lytic transglycosylase domain-containing protein [Gammaproteobacteria bacterium]MDH5650953.1 lytic transglycosylase domain-containing protein [Gammaproteobacteria bacterium]